MFSIGDGKRKFIFNYKAIESIIGKPHKYRNDNYLTSYNKYFHDNNSQLKFIKNNYDKEKSSQYFINKSKQLKKLKQKIQTKKVDILINKALEKTNNIRNYSNNFKYNKNLRQKLNLNILKSPKIKIKIKNNEVGIPSFSQDKIKENILNTANHFFPERYLDITEITKDNRENCKYDKTKKKLEEEYKKIYSIKYIRPENSIKYNKDLKTKKKLYKLISPAITIYNKNNKNKLISNVDSDKISKKIDIGLNTIPFIY